MNRFFVAAIVAMIACRVGTCRNLMVPDKPDFKFNMGIKFLAWAVHNWMSNDEYRPACEVRC